MTHDETLERAVRFLRKEAARIAAQQASWKLLSDGSYEQALIVNGYYEVEKLANALDAMREKRAKENGK